MTRILINHLGYHCSGPKKAIIQSSEPLAGIELTLETADGAIVQTVKALPAQRPAQWSQGWFHELDFTFLDTPGNYCLRGLVNGRAICTGTFPVKDVGLPEQALSDLLFYFKGQRSSGPWDQADHNVPFVSGRHGTVDAHGGWYDASGDFSKYLSHLSYANYMNPQQTPQVVWNFAESRALLEGSTSRRLQGLLKRLDEEAAHGADFLVRMQDPEGFFYMTVFDRWSKDPKQREICSYSTMKGLKHETWQASYRQGGGMAIAALARLGAQNNQWGEYSPATYLEKAAKGFKHLEQYNSSYCDDQAENIIDDYCALLAATELAAASHHADPGLRIRASLSPSETYLSAARLRMENLAGRLITSGEYRAWLRADTEGERPYFHAAEAGLPVVALLRYLEVETDEAFRIKAARLAKTILCFELGLTKATENPFGLARQYVKSIGGPRREAFFFPHENESGYWWQGENARLGSLASAALWASRVPAVMAAPLLVTPQVKGKDLKEPSQIDLESYGFNQLNWILGLNPYDMCMLQGRGRNNPDYTEFFPNAPGGVCNGITSGYDNEEDIDFLPAEFAHDGANNWRWGEQWIPHGAWLFLGLSETAALKHR